MTAQIPRGADGPHLDEEVPLEDMVPHVLEAAGYGDNTGPCGPSVILSGL